MNLYVWRVRGQNYGFLGKNISEAKKAMEQTYCMKDCQIILGGELNIICDFVGLTFNAAIVFTHDGEHFEQTLL